MIHRIEVREKKGFYDAVGSSVKKDIRELGYGKKIVDVKSVQVYIIDTDITESRVREICEALLIDPITQYYTYDTGSGHEAAEDGYGTIEIAYNPGVMDPVEESAKKAIKDLGITGIRAVKTARKYLIRGRLSDSDIHTIAENILYNKVIQHVVKGRSTNLAEVPPYQFRLKEVDILKAGDIELNNISRRGQLFLSLDEMRTIKKYFRKIGRNPTDCELETIAQTWSEHCKHKTFRGLVDYKEEILNPKSEILNKSKISNPKLKKGLINNLLKSTVMRVTEELKKPWCVSVFKDNSGVIRFDDKHNVCFKVETHNHPSALEPYGGAGTGIGGVIRDPLGTGLGAKPIINTDIFCFGTPDHPYSKLPKGALHPKRIMKGVVAGVRDYGNRMGIPTSNGAVLFDKNFVGNPLVFCGNVGIMPKDKSFKHVRKGNLIVVVGGRTGRDGIHGATFSSGELTHESKGVSGSAVQIGNPIQEKKMADALLQARDLDLYDAITDCGAGGLSSAVGEMGDQTGAIVNLELVPLKYKGLRYDEIWISEAQERMVLAVDPKKLEDLKEIFERENVEATVIGRFEGGGRLKILYEGNLVCDLEMKFLHEGLPKVKRNAVWKRPHFAQPRIKAKNDLTEDLLELLSSWNICSKEWIIRQYDHEVQGGSVIKPLQGVNGGGPGDACVTRPLLDSKKGIILSCGINPDYGKIDPYWMAASVIDEALRQVVSVGGDIRVTAILDNFCWGNTNRPEALGELVRASFACYDIAKAYGVPFISGKDSLNNEYSTGTKKISIPPTLLISCISIMDDVTKAVTMDAKKAGSAIYIVGTTYDELGGSQYYKLKNAIGNDVPRVDASKGRHVMLTLAHAINKGIVRSCHDCSDGGMGVALAEMAFAGNLGMNIHLGAFGRPKDQPDLSDDKLLFSESNTRFIAEVSDEKAFARAMKGVAIWKLGNLIGEKSFKIFNADGRQIINTSIDRLKSAWQKPFKEM